MKKKPITTAQHVYMARKLRSAVGLITELRDECDTHLNKSHPIIKSFDSLIFKNFNTLRSRLDDEYHRTVDNEDYEHLGHVYYNGGNK